MTTWQGIDWQGATDAQPIVQIDPPGSTTTGSSGQIAEVHAFANGRGGFWYQDFPASAMDASTSYTLIYSVFPTLGDQSVEVISGRGVNNFTGPLDTRVTIHAGSPPGSATLTLDAWETQPNPPAGALLTNFYGEWHQIAVVATVAGPVGSLTGVQQVYVDGKPYLAASSVNPAVNPNLSVGKPVSIVFGQFAGFSATEDDYFYDDFCLNAD